VGTRGQDPDGTPLLALDRVEVEMAALDPPAAPEVAALIAAVRAHLTATGEPRVTLRQVWGSADG